MTQPAAEPDERAVRFLLSSRRSPPSATWLGGISWMRKAARTRTLSCQALSLLFNLSACGFLLGFGAFDGLADVVAGGRVTVLRPRAGGPAGLRGEAAETLISGIVNKWGAYCPEGPKIAMIMQP